MVNWVDGAIPNPPSASPETVRETERELGVSLPRDFLAIAATHQGAAPVPNRILLPNGWGTAVAHLFHFEDAPFPSNILAAIFPWQDSLDEGLIPFAADIGGDLFCFSYSAGDADPSVVFFSVDTGALPLAPDFTAFLALLHEREEH